jgi:hypothetical protein
MSDQIFFVQFDDREPQVGMGFNTRTGDFVGTALAVEPASPSEASPGQRVQGSASIIKSHQELVDSLDAGMSIEGRYGVASGSAKVNFSQKTMYNSTSTFVLVQVSVTNALRRCHDPRIPPGSPAEQFLSAGRLDDFHRTFGDAYVRGIKTGGEFYAVVRITSTDKSLQNSLSVQLAAEFNGLVTSGSFKAELAKSHTESTSQSEILVSYFQQAGKGATAEMTLDIEAVMQRARTFATIVDASPFGIAAEIATYDTVPIPVPTQAEVENLQVAMTDAQTKRLHYLTVKNDMEFADEHPQFFVNPPPHEQLQVVVTAYTSALNGVMAHLANLARGRINPAAVFDAGPFSLPPIPALTARDERGQARTVVLPDFLTLPGQDVNQDGQRLSGNYLRETIGNVVRLGLTYRVVNISGLDQWSVDNGDAWVQAQTPAAGQTVPIGSEVVLQV